MIVLGVDVGGTKTHGALVDAHGEVLAFHADVSGSPEYEGFEHMRTVNARVVDSLCQAAAIAPDRIDAAVIGSAGYNFPSQTEQFEAALRRLPLPERTLIVNDAALGLADREQGVSLVAGTSCNCRGINRRGKIGAMIGYGLLWGEGAGALEVAHKAIQAVIAAWTRRSESTGLEEVLLHHYGYDDIARLIEDLVIRNQHMDPAFAPAVVQVAEDGDAVAQEIVRWAGQELGSMAVGVIRQLDLQSDTFDVVMAGGFFKIGDMLTDPLAETVYAVAPRARLVPFHAPPVAGALAMALKYAGYPIDSALRDRIAAQVMAARG